MLSNFAIATEGSSTGTMMICPNLKSQRSFQIESILIELESDFPRLEIPTPDEQTDIMTQLVAARLNAGLGKEPEANIDPMGVIKITDMSPCNDLDP